MGYGLLNAYSRLTGRAPIPAAAGRSATFRVAGATPTPADACRTSGARFRDRRIPVDAFIYDYDWFN